MVKPAYQITVISQESTFWKLLKLKQLKLQGSTKKKTSKRQRVIDCEQSYYFSLQSYSASHLSTRAATNEGVSPKRKYMPVFSRLVLISY